MQNLFVALIFGAAIYTLISAFKKEKQKSKCKCGKTNCCKNK